MTSIKKRQRIFYIADCCFAVILNSIREVPCLDLKIPK